MKSNQEHVRQGEVGWFSLRKRRIGGISSEQLLGRDRDVQGEPLSCPEPGQEVMGTP